MEETERRERDIGEPPEPCEECGGTGSFWRKEAGGSLSGSRTLCRRCLGTGQK
jgi:DnaJ-class molecular chaperone